MKNKLLVIAAHPDDDILGCGGTLSKYKNKYKIKVIFIGEGTSCRYENFEKNKAEIRAEIRKRENNSKNALKSLGINLYSFYDLPCGRLNSLPIIEINKIVEKNIKLFKPNIIFTHSEKDCNNDHRVIFRSVSMATRPTLKHKVEQIYTFKFRMELFRAI